LVIIQKKENYARNAINSCASKHRLNYLDKFLGEMYDELKKNRDAYNVNMKNLIKLHTEYLDDKKKFVRKYAKPRYSFEGENIAKFLKMRI